MKTPARNRDRITLLIALISVVIFSTLTGCVYEEFHGEMLSQSYVQKIESWEKKKLPIEKLLFEGLKTNDLSVIYVLYPTLEELCWEERRLGVRMEGSGGFREKRMKIMTGQFKEVRRASEDRGLDWRNASLIETTGQNTGQIRLRISDGKTSIAIFALISSYESFGGRNNIKLAGTVNGRNYYLGEPNEGLKGEIGIRTMRMTDGPILYPFEEGDADILRSWDYTKASEEETRKIRDLYIKRKVHKDYISFRRGVPNFWNPFGLEFDTRSNKWIYRDDPPFILEIDFSSDGYVTDVKVTKEEKK